MKNNVQIIVVIILVALFLGFLIVYEKTHMVVPIQKEVESVKEEILKNDSIFEMVDRKWAEQKIHRQQTENEMDSLMRTLDGKKLTIELMEGIKEKFIKAKKECDKKSIIIDSLTTNIKKKEQELVGLNERFALKSEQFMGEIEYYVDREIKLITTYSYKVDSLKKIISLIDVKDLDKVENIITNKEKKNRKKGRKN